MKGSASLFQCTEIRQNEILLDKDSLPDAYAKCPCLIKTVMMETENQMKEYFKSKTLGWLHEQVKNKVRLEHGIATFEWFGFP